MGAALASLVVTCATLSLTWHTSASATVDGPRTISGSHPSWATDAKDDGALPANTELTARVYLAGQDPAGLAAYAKAVSTPGNAAYGHFLSAAQVRQQFGSTPRQVLAVTSWLRSAGLKITARTAHYIDVTGTAAAHGRAFDTQLHRYSIGGKLRHAPASNLVIPASVAGSVLGVSGLTTTTPRVRPQSATGPTPSARAAAGLGATPAAGFPTTSTCSQYWGQKQVNAGPATYTAHTPYDQCSLAPSQLRRAYGITASGLTGKGATVAIVDAYGSSTMLDDANHFATVHGDKAFAPGQYTEVVDPTKWNNQDGCGGPDGWAPEEALDVEMVHGLAPAADVVYVGANSCTDQDLLGALSTIVDNHLADVVSNSWGEIMHSTQGDLSPSLVLAYEEVFEQGAIEGIGFDFSAGDCGDSSPAAAAAGVNCDPSTNRAQADYPSSDPWVTSVGGTALGISTTTGSYGFETDMGDLRSSLSADGSQWSPMPGAFYFGGGGGTSQDFAEPWFQKGVVPTFRATTLMTGAHTKSPRRVTPDVAMNGDLYTSVLVGMSDGAPYGEGGYGGTSVAAPEFSAVQADAIQARGGQTIGFADPELYARAGSTAFHDVVDQAAARNTAPLDAVADFGAIGGVLHVGLVAFGEDTSLNAVRGYDNATGLGSPTRAYLNSFR